MCLRRQGGLDEATYTRSYMLLTNGSVYLQDLREQALTNPDPLLIKD